MSAEEKDAPDESSDEEIYEVERILESKNTKKKKQYLIRWKGYGSEYDTWEPEENLIESAGEILKEYKAKEASMTPPSAPKPLKKRPVKSEVSDGEENDVTSAKRQRKSKSKSTSISDDEKDDEEYSGSKRQASRKRASAQRQTPVKKVSPKPKPLGAIGQAWLYDEDSDDEDEKKKDAREDAEKKPGKGEESKRKSKSKSSLFEEEKKEEEEKVAERNAEKERKKAEKEKRKEEKQKHRETPVPVTESTPKITIKLPKKEENERQENGNDGGLNAIMRLRRSTFHQDKFFATILIDSEEKEIPLDEAWKLNPKGLMQYLLSRHSFD